MITSLHGLADFINIFVIVNLSSYPSKRVKKSEGLKLICIGAGLANEAASRRCCSRKESKNV